MNANIFVKIDTVFVYKINKKELFLVEDEYFIYKLLKSKPKENFYILFEDNINKDIISKFLINDTLKDLILNNHINNFNIIDFGLYIHSIDDDETIENLNNFENIENLYKDFIIHLNKFRKEQILKYTFNIKQRRISRKKLLEIKENIKKELHVNWKYDDVF
jgi:hypothetical protein